jgi:hypothetical protein
LCRRRSGAGATRSGRGRSGMVRTGSRAGLSTPDGG